MTGPDRATPTLVLIARVWAVAGALALVVALVTRSPVVAVFGGLALVAAGVLFGVKSAQDRSVQRNSRVTSASPTTAPTRASDILGRRREQPPRPQPPPGEPAPPGPPPEGSAPGPDLGKSESESEDATAPVDPASTRRTGPRRRPEPDVPRTARNRGRRNPTVGRDTGPFPTPGSDQAPTGAREDPGAEAPAERDERGAPDAADEDDVVDEPTERREPDDAEIDDAEIDDAEIDDAETVDEPGPRPDHR